MLRDAEVELAPSVTYLINKSIIDGTVPDVWKIARVSPLYKSEDKILVENYRPIAVLPILSKVMERAVYAQLSAHLDQLGFLYQHQYGFRRGHSTAQAIGQLNNWVLEAMDRKELTGLLFVDISKAFDSINHKILLGKLEHIGLSESSLKWFKSYLADRRQCVCINGELSETRQIDFGVPQGSVLGPLLFNIYVNSLLTCVKKCRMILYADDAVLIYAASTLDSLQDAFVLDFKLMCDWYTANRLSLNVKKTKMMLAGSRTMLSTFQNFEFELDGEPVSRVSEFKYLGIMLDEKWNWKSHISNLSQKLGYRLSVFNRILHLLDKNARLAYYNGLVLPHLDYADTVWGDQPGMKSEMAHLQGFQNRFAKKIVDSKLSSDEAIAVLEWIPLTRRRFGHRCVDVHNAIKGNIPEHFDTFRTPLTTLHGYNTRNGNLPPLPNVRTDWGKRVTCFRALRDWTSLPDDLKRPMPISIFRRQLKKFLSDN